MQHNPQNQVINNTLHYRNGPDKEYQPYTAQQLTFMLLDAQKEIARLKNDLNTTWLCNYTPRDWVEDAAHENGNYQNKCCQCDHFFLGHKRRVVCKECDRKNEEKWGRMTAEEKMEVVKSMKKKVDENLKYR